jgi:hypothetical protein
MIGHPDLDWVGLARSMGVPGAKATTMEAFNDRFAQGIATRARSSSRSHALKYALEAGRGLQLLHNGPYAAA